MKINLLELENKYRFEYGVNLIAGVDEVGRGPLAGPVVACSIIMNDKIIEGVDDSKKLSKKKREYLNEKILENAIAHSVVLIDSERIDSINILNATKEAMFESIVSLKVKPELVLIDAVKLKIPKYNVVSIIKGDTLSYSIACASIVAKVARDKLMVEYDEIYPEYEFAKNKGYGTKNHIESLIKNGKTPLHRETFIKNFF